MADQVGTRATAVLALADGTLFHGEGYGAEGQTTGLVHFDTSMTGYQEILSDPARSGAIVVFTFPHIGNVGATAADDQSERAGAAGVVSALVPTAPSNWRAEGSFHDWLAGRGVIGIGGVDTRRLTRHLRQHGTQGAVLVHDPKGGIDTQALVAAAREAGPPAPYQAVATPAAEGDGPLLAMIDLGHRRDLVSVLFAYGARVAGVAASASAEDVLALAPAGIVVSDGPGKADDPGAVVLPLLRGLLDQTDIPVFGTGLGHQLLAMAAGAVLSPLPHGSHGANHPARAEADGHIRITATGHDATVSRTGLPDNLRVTESSRFDGSILGLEWAQQPVISVQYRPDPSDPNTPLARFMALVRGES